MINGKYIVTFESNDRTTGCLIKFIWIGRILYPAFVNSLITTDRVLDYHRSRRQGVWCNWFSPVPVIRLHAPSVKKPNTSRWDHSYIYKLIAYLFLPYSSIEWYVFHTIHMPCTVKNNAIILLEKYVFSLQG